VTNQAEQDHLDDLVERAIELPEINRGVAAIALSMLTQREAWTAGGRFLDAVEYLATAPGVSADEARQAGAGILALAAEGD
jgi:hypothetical protein